MTSPRRPHVADPGGTIHLRPHGATILCIIVWALVGLIVGDSVLRAGAASLPALPFALLICALVWAVLWAPRVVLRDEAVEVRNVLVTHLLPFTAIHDVRIGAMLRFDVARPDGSERTITAWNAPTLGKVKGPSAREMREARTFGHRLESASERLLQDQAACRSSVIRARWSRAQDQAQDRAQPASAAGPDHSGSAVATQRPNSIVIATLGVLMALVAWQLLR